MTQEINKITRLAIVATGHVWTIYDTWTSIKNLRTPRLFHGDEMEEAEKEVERAREYIEEDDHIDPASVRVAWVTIDFNPL